MLSNLNCFLVLANLPSFYIPIIRILKFKSFASEYSQLIAELIVCKKEYSLQFQGKEQRIQEALGKLNDIYDNVIAPIEELYNFKSLDGHVITSEYKHA